MLNVKLIKSIRLAHGLTQDEAGRKAGFTQPQVMWAQIENGDRTNITLDTLAAVAKALGKTPGELLQ